MSVFLALALPFMAGFRQFHGRRRTRFWAGFPLRDTPSSSGFSADLENFTVIFRAYFSVPPPCGGRRAIDTLFSPFVPLSSRFLLFLCDVRFAVHLVPCVCHVGSGISHVWESRCPRSDVPSDAPSPSAVRGLRPPPIFLLLRGRLPLFLPLGTLLGPRLWGSWAAGVGSAMALGGGGCAAVKSVGVRSALSRAAFMVTGSPGARTPERPSGHRPVPLAGGAPCPSAA